VSNFPDPLDLPDEVFKARQERKKRIISSASRGVILRLIIVAAEFAGVFYSGSAALMTDAIFSLVDVTFSLFLITCVVLAGRPPDEEHPFGHGRYEPLIGLQSGLFMVLLGTGMFFQQLYEVGSATNSEALDKPIWIIPLLAVVLLEISYQIVVRTAKKHNSPALAADAVHYRIDSMTSFFAMVALILADLLPEWNGVIDHTGALVISVAMAILGFFAARENLHQLLDRAPDQKFFNQVKTAAEGVDEVREIEKTRIQLYGPDAHVDIDVEVDPAMSVDRAHRVSQEVRFEIQKAWPAVRDVTVHIEPYYPGDH
jgi:cation diffusion facilitator family transporter